MPHRRRGAGRGQAPTAVVIGGGIAGLLAARELSAASVAVTVLEAAPTFGGCVDSHEVAGLVLDSGAESFATRSPVISDLAAELGLSERIVAPNPIGAWVQLPGGAAPLPKTGVLGIPGDLRDPEVRRTLGLWGAWRAGMDKWLPVSVGTSAEACSVSELVRARMGRAVLERLVAPVVGGVHSADPEVLDVDMVAPGLRRLVREEGSLAAAVTKLRASSQPGSAVGGLAGGMHTLVTALTEELTRAGVQLRTNTRVSAIERGDVGNLAAVQSADDDGGNGLNDDSRSSVGAGLSAEAGPEAGIGPDVDADIDADTGRNADAGSDAGAQPTPEPKRAHPWTGSLRLIPLKGRGGKAARASRWRVHTDDGEWPADAVVIATEGGTAVELISGELPAVAPFKPAAGPEIKLVTLVLDLPELDVPSRGTGVLVAPQTPGIQAKALTHATAKWGWLAEEAGPGTHVLRLSYGRSGAGSEDRRSDRSRTPEPQTDEELLGAAVSDAAALLGVHMTAADLLGSDIIRWRGTLPFAAVGHQQRVAKVRELAGSLPGLAMVGGWLAGNGLVAVTADAICAGRTLAESLVPAGTEENQSRAAANTQGARPGGADAQAAPPAAANTEGARPGGADPESGPEAPAGSARSARRS